MSVSVPPLTHSFPNQSPFIRFVLWMLPFLRITRVDTTERPHSLFIFMRWRSNGTPLQCSCLENPRDGRAWWAAVYGVAQSWTRLRRLSSSSSSDIRESESRVSDSLQPHGLYGPWHSPGQNTAVGSLSLLQGIFPTQEWNPGLLHCRQILYQLSLKGSPYIYYCV